MSKIYNFSAGPAVLDSTVLEATSKAAIDYQGHGISLMEMSHRSKPVMDMVAEFCPFCSEPIDEIDWDYDDENTKQESEGT